jgi:hypothetical protein
MKTNIEYCPFCEQNTEHISVPQIIHGVTTGRIYCRCTICGADSPVRSRLEKQTPTEKLMGEFAEMEKTCNNDENETIDLAQQTHYTAHNIEPFDVIEDWKLPYHLGNVIKYIGRAGLKPGEPYLKEMKKAKVYLDRFIKLLESEERHGEGAFSKK